MIKYLCAILAMAVCLPFPADAEQVFAEDAAFQVAAATKLGRGIGDNAPVNGRFATQIDGEGGSAKASLSISTSCGAGKYLADSGCRKCPKGTYSPGGTLEECLPCEPGTAQDSMGQSSCKVCGAGYYAAGTGNTYCTKCPAGSYSGIVAGEKGNSSCTPCDVGKKCPNEGMGAPEACPSGTYAAGTGNKECLSCPAGTYSEGGKSQTTINGETIITPVSECTPCEPGTFQNETKKSFCKACGKGTYAAGTGNTSCLICPAGAYADGGANDGNGKAIEAGAAECTPCEPGSAKDEEGKQDCSPCKAGTYAAGTGNTSCTDCPAGTYSDTGAQFCEFCDKGTFAKGTGNKNCTACPTGKYADSTGSTECTVCPAGTHSNEVKDAKGNVQRVSCVPCEPGTHQSQTNKGKCDACPAGTFSTGNAVECTPCPVGMYQNLSGQKDCLPCVNGLVSGARKDGKGATQCISCGDGYFVQGTSCKKCSEGCKVCTNERICEECEAGRGLVNNICVTTSLKVKDPYGEATVYMEQVPEPENIYMNKTGYCKKINGQVVCRCTKGMDPNKNPHAVYFANEANCHAFVDKHPELNLNKNQCESSVRGGEICKYYYYHGAYQDPGKSDTRIPRKYYAPYDVVLHDFGGGSKTLGVAADPDEALEAIEEKDRKGIFCYTESNKIYCSCGVRNGYQTFMTTDSCIAAGKSYLRPANATTDQIKNTWGCTSIAGLSSLCPIGVAESKRHQIRWIDGNECKYAETVDCHSHGCNASNCKRVYFKDGKTMFDLGDNDQSDNYEAIELKEHPTQAGYGSIWYYSHHVDYSYHRNKVNMVGWNATAAGNMRIDLKCKNGFHFPGHGKKDNISFSDRLFPCNYK